MGYLLAIMVIAAIMSSPGTGSFREAQNSNESKAMDCRSSAVDGIRGFGSSAYGGNSDLDHDSDDIVIHCRKPIAVSKKVVPQDQFLADHLTEESKRISKQVSQLPNQQGLSFVVHAYHKSQNMSSKIASALKSQLVAMRLTTLENEPTPFRFTDPTLKIKSLRDRCLQGEFHQADIARVFAFKGDDMDTRLRAAVCTQNQWRQI